MGRDKKCKTYFNARANAVAITLHDVVDEADNCAVLMLLCGVKYRALPTVCGAYSSATLDYWSQATAYTRRVTAAYPDSVVALVGHSLGAAVAIGTAEQLLLEKTGQHADGVCLSGDDVRVLGLSTPGSAFGLQKRFGLNATALECALQGRLISVVNEWDPLVQAGRDYWVGPVCVYGGPQPSSCTQCVAQSPPTSSAALELCSCGECAHDTHGMDVIQKLIRRGGPRWWVHVTAAEAEAAKAVAAQ